jgi:hypothetical protein
MIRTIEFRRREEFKNRALLMEWQTRTLASFIAGTVPVEKGKKNPLAAAVSEIRIPLLGEDSEADNNEEAEADVSPENQFDFIESGSKVAEARNARGSFERLRAGTGR